METKRVALSLWVTPATFEWLRATREDWSIQGRAESVIEEARARGATESRVCACGCGTRLTGNTNQKTATPACRKRLERKKRHT